jgi:ABC-2 type transport system permease protein
MFPIENMPGILQAISHIVPTRWFFDILKDIMVKGLGLSYIIKPALILGGMTVVFLAVAFRKFKIRLA